MKKQGFTASNCWRPSPATGLRGLERRRARHNGRLDGLFYDGHIQSLKPDDLSVRNFREPNSLPALSSYPGE